MRQIKALYNITKLQAWLNTDVQNTFIRNIEFSWDVIFSLNLRPIIQTNKPLLWLTVTTYLRFSNNDQLSIVNDMANSDLAMRTTVDIFTIPTSTAEELSPEMKKG